MMTILKKKSRNRALIIFVRSPKLGKVKTRLAKEMGDQAALDIYIQLLDHTRSVAQKVQCTRWLFYSDEIVKDSWSEDKFQKHLQSDGDLGNKMYHAMSLALDVHDKAIIIGSDCAQLNSDIIERAYDALDTHDVVIGPTLDGGYYLLGIKSLRADLFKNMTWSVDTVYEKTIHKINKNNLTHFVLNKLSDIDHQKDWDLYGLDASKRS